MPKPAAKSGGRKKDTVYLFIRKLIQEGEYAWFVNERGRFLIKWDEAVRLYIEDRAKRNPKFKKNRNQRKASNTLRAALLHHYKKDGAKEFAESRKLGGKSNVIERQFQMPSRVFLSLFGSSAELPSNREHASVDQSDTSGISGSDPELTQEDQSLVQWLHETLEYDVDMTPKESPMQGGLPFRVSFSPSLDAQVTSVHAKFVKSGIDLGNVNMVILPDCLLGRRIPGASSSGWADVIFQTHDGIHLGSTKIFYYPDEREVVVMVKAPSVFENLCKEMSYHTGNSSNTCSDEETQRSIAIGNAKQVQFLRLLVYTAAREGAQQFIEMIFSTSAGRLVFDSYKNSQPLPEIVAKASGHNKTACYLEGVTKRFLDDISTVEECPKKIGWSELANAAKEAQRKHELNTEEESSHLKSGLSTDVGYLGDIETSSSEPYSSGSEEDFPFVYSEEAPTHTLARGPSTLKANNKATSERKTSIRISVMIIGPQRAGKTSLMRSLMGESFDINVDSTVGVEVNSYFKVSKDVWRAEEKGERVSSGGKSPHEYHFAEEREERVSSGKKFPHEHQLVPSKASVLSYPASQDVTTVLGDIPPDLDTTYKWPCNEESEDQTTKKAQIGDGMQDAPTNVHAILWDFGGEPIYHTTHPIFLSPNAIYLLVHDLSQDPYEKAKPFMKDSRCIRSSFEYLNLWLTAAASLRTQDKTPPVALDSNALPDKLPLVFLVCTHADQPYGGDDPKALARMAFDHLNQTNPYQAHLHKDVFLVDNTKSGHESECPGVVRLREEVLAAAKELPQAKKAIPIEWLRFEKKIQAMKEEGHRWICLERAKQIAFDECSIGDDDEFSALLNFLQDQMGLIILNDSPRQSGRVFLDVQWLVDVFKKVITVKPYDDREQKFKDAWCKLEKEGVLERELLEHVWDSLYDSGVNHESLIRIMEKFSLLCPWPSLDNLFSRNYLVPSMVMEDAAELKIGLIESAEIPSIFFKFESGQVPLGLFPRLVLSFFKWYKQETSTTERPRVNHNFARFYNSKDNCSLILLCHVSSIEVVLHRDASGHEVGQSSNKMTSFVGEKYGTFACTVRRQLELMIECMRREFRSLQNMKYTVQFLCPVCCQGVVLKYCPTHISERCKHEQCLHFLCESDLCRHTKIVCCTRSATAKINSISVKGFEAGSCTGRNQPKDEDIDDGNLPSLEATTKVSLPDNVQRSLLSPWCYAYKDVWELNKYLATHKDLLELPNTDSKKTIRCLAKKASCVAKKKLKRLDVVERLRDSTLAGTTGPLLPENLPVQDMPISTSRELTTSLSGGNEWMELAEGLDLTPQHKRYFDDVSLTQ